jgi:hypothetical protein
VLGYALGLQCFARQAAAPPPSGWRRATAPLHPSRAGLTKAWGLPWLPQRCLRGPIRCCRYVFRLNTMTTVTRMYSVLSRVAK